MKNGEDCFFYRSIPAWVTFTVGAIWLTLQTWLIWWLFGLLVPA